LLEDRIALVGLVLDSLGEVLEGDGWANPFIAARDAARSTIARAAE